MKEDPAIDDVREVRRRISQSLGNDPRRLVDYYLGLQEARKEQSTSAPDSSVAVRRRASGIIEYEELYTTFIRSRGVGSHDHVSDSVKAYVSYLKSVSRLLDQPISPSLLRSEQDIEAIASKLSGSRAPKSITNYKSAMKQYVAMVEHHRLTSSTRPSSTSA